MPAHYIMATIKFSGHKTFINTETILRIEPQVYRKADPIEEFYVGSRIVYAYNATSEKVIEPPSDLYTYLTFSSNAHWASECDRLVRCTRQEMKKNEEWILSEFINKPIEE